MTIGEIISPIKRTIKAYKQDALITDRYVYSLIKKYASTLLKRQDVKDKMITYLSSFRTVGYVELIEVDKVSANCAGIKSNCTIMRTKEKLLNIVEGENGPLIRSVTSIDGSTEFKATYPTIYTSISNSSNFKYIKNKFYWYNDNYLYFPDIKWKAVSIDAMWDSITDEMICSKEDKVVCKMFQDQQVTIPEYLMSYITQQIYQIELNIVSRIPTDTLDDKQNILR